MKITKRQLKRIIKEEKTRLLKESSGFADMAEAIDKLLGQGMDPIELANELRGMADEVEETAAMQYDMQREMERAR